jgi:hypothetical protein
VGGSVDARMTIQAPLTYPICSTEFIKATAWYPAGDTLVPLGASVAQVNLKKSTDLTVHTTYGSCDKRTVGVAAARTGDSECQVLTTQGCTNPPRPFEHITLNYSGPDGKPIYHDVVTDKNGCFEDFVVNPQGRPWSVQTEYPGNVCNARTDGGRQTVFVPPGGVFPPSRLLCCLLWGAFIAALMAVVVFLAVALCGVRWARYALAVAGALALLTGFALLIYCVPVSSRCCSLRLLCGAVFVAAAALLVSVLLTKQKAAWYFFGVTLVLMVVFVWALRIYCGG